MTRDHSTRTTHKNLDDNIVIAKTRTELPSALDHLDDILVLSGNHRIAVFLDYDGTLTAIVARQQDAILAEPMRTALQALSELSPMAIISGRDSMDVRQRVALEKIYYAGNHGFEITVPGGSNLIYENGLGFLPQLDMAEYDLRATLNGIRGCEVERKHFTIAVHYRDVAPKETMEVKTRVINVKAAYPRLRLARGKKILELLPQIPWNKGMALNWLIQAMKLDRQNIFPFYLGDDVSDEDAFRAVQNNGVGILVAARSKNTAATFILKDIDEVQKFLELITLRLRDKGDLLALR